MNSDLLRLLFASVLLIWANCSRVCYDEPDDIDRLTARASVRINSYPGILISDRLVYTTGTTLYDLKEQPELFVTVPSRPNIRVKVKKTFVHTAFLDNLSAEHLHLTPATPTVCDDLMIEECVPECLRQKDGLFRERHTRNHGLVLLEESISLCEREGDAVVARIDTTQEAGTKTGSEECFHAETIGQFSNNTVGIKILRSMSLHESPQFPHCHTPMMNLLHEKSSNYKDEFVGNVIHGNAHPLQCITNEGKTLTVKSSFTVGTAKESWGPRIAEFSAELMAVIIGWGEFDNYINSHSKCSAFLEKYPYISVREKYLKANL